LRCRKDAERLRQLAASPAAALVPVCCGRSLVSAGSAVTVPLAAAAAQGLVAMGTLTFLGLKPGAKGADGAAVFAAECEEVVAEQVSSLTGSHALAQVHTSPGALRSAPPGDSESRSRAEVTQAQWVDLRREGPACAAGDAALMATAAGLVGWHAATAFCSVTGRPLAARQGGYARYAAVWARASAARAHAPEPSETI